MIGRPSWAAFTLVSRSEPAADYGINHGLQGTVHVRAGESAFNETRLRCGRTMKSENVGNEVPVASEEYRLITCHRCAQWARRALNGEFR